MTALSTPAIALVMTGLLSVCMTKIATPAKLSAGAPRVERTTFGALADGTSVYAYRLRNDHGVSVKVLDLGGIVVEVNVPDREGRMRNVVLSLATLSSYLSMPTFNALVGRYANRLKGGVTIDGRHFDLAANASGVTLHGGTAPFGGRRWSVEIPRREDGAAAVVLSLVSPDGDQGFPGELHIQVTYALTEADALRIEYRTSTDRETVVNLTQHIYFNLAGSGAVYAERLQVFADAYTPIDADLVPTGELTPVAGSAFDFRKPHALGERIDSGEPQMILGHGYDHNFVLRRLPGEALAPAARLYDRQSGRILEIRTTEPGLQVYSGNFLNGSLLDADGTTLRQGYGVALETQHFPNSPNVAAFPTTLLRPGAVLTSTTVLSFLTDRSRHEPRRPAHPSRQSSVDIDH